MSKFRLLRIAQIELDETFAYYEAERVGLGSEFLDDFTNALDRIELFPEAWHAFDSKTHRCLLRRFPFGIIYQILDEKIMVIAVAHLHRKPKYWHNRV